MPRKPRFYLPDVPLHIVQRGHSKEPVFFESRDYATYAYWLNEGAKRYQVAIHAFVLMTNHVHLLITPPEEDSASLFMQYLGRHYVPYINHKYDRSGSIWEGRYKASLVDAEDYFFTVMRYIELNPVRAGMVEAADHYRWSSHCHNIGIRKIQMVRFHPLFNALGKTKRERYETYKALFGESLEPGAIKRIHEAWQSGTPLGNDRFRDRVEAQLALKLGQYRRGRPKKG